MKEVIIFIHTEYIKLDQFLKFAGAVQTGGQAKEEITAGTVFVDGKKCLIRGKKIRSGNRVIFDDTEYLIEKR